MKQQRLGLALCCTPVLLLLLLLTACPGSMAQEEEDNGVGSVTTESPDELLCDPDPCQDENQEDLVCLRYITAECLPNSNFCTPNFFWRGRNVTDNCDVRTCDDRECPPTRNCTERTMPRACPPEEPDCRQYLRTRCELVPVDRLMSCEEVECEEGMACRLRLRGEDFPPVVRCFPQERVRDCTPGACNRGFVCEDQGSSVLCVPAPPTEPPTSALKCEDLSCPPDAPICLVSAIPEEMVEVAQCNAAHVPPPSPPTPCSEGGGFCEGAETCLDLTQDGELIGNYCSLFECAGDPSSCPAGSVCMLNASVGITVIQVGSACVPPQVGFTGIGCAEREGCPENLACQEAVFPSPEGEEGGVVLGSFCAERVSLPAESCEEVTCFDPAEVCMSFSTGPDNTLAQCGNRQQFLDLVAPILN